MCYKTYKLITFLNVIIVIEIFKNLKLERKANGYRSAQVWIVPSKIWAGYEDFVFIFL